MNKARHYIGLTFAVILIISFAHFLTTIITMASFMFLVKSGVVPEDWLESPNMGHILVLIGCIINLVGIVMVTIAVRILMRPIRKLITQIDRLSSGDFRARLDFGEMLSKHDIFLELEQKFNKMAEELDSTEMLRSDFINNFSHEFKTPIVSIAGFAKLLKKGNLSEEQQMEYLDIIEKESSRLSSMATNVLNLTRIENQTILADVTRFNLSEQLRTGVLLLERKWEQKNLGFQLNFGEYMINANEELLLQVWINLIDNAIKFSPENETIEISVIENTYTLTVLILNAGAEIEERNMKRIFNKFFQADESHSTEGNGIGLAIVKRVVELHKGCVSVRSENGIVQFEVELPK